MRKLGCVILATVALLAFSMPAYADGRRSHSHGKHRSHHHVAHRPHFGPRVFVGFGPAWPWWGPVYRPYPVYTAPVVIERSPPVYIQQNPPVQQQQYWYYCEASRTYYPYVQQCPGGWMTVVPPTPGTAPN